MLIYAKIYKFINKFCSDCTNFFGRGIFNLLKLIELGN